MREFITGEALANWLGMLRVVDKRTFVLVEGPSDSQVLDPQIDAQVATTFPGYSKPRVLKALAAAEERGLSRVVAIVDLDWDGLLHPMESSPNVVYADDYDLDATVILTGDVLERIVSNYSDRELREKYLAENNVSPKEALLEIASTVGVMRFLSERNAHGIRCRAFPVHAAMSKDGTQVDISLLAKVAVRRSPDANITEAALAVSVQESYRGLADQRRFSNGHDLAAALSTLLRHWGGNASRDVIERTARSTFGCPELKQTKLFASMEEWARSEDTHVWSCV